MKTYEQIMQETFIFGYKTAKSHEEHKVIECPDFIADFAEDSFWQGVEALYASLEPVEDED